MKRFTSNQQKWLKSFHLLFMAVWVACGFILLSFSLVSAGLSSGEHLYMLNYITDFIDMKILVPSAMLTLLTGLLYSMFTGWGFFKHRWLVFKWIVTVSIIVTGTIFTGPWIAEMVTLAGREGIGVFQNSRYLFINRCQITVGMCMNLTLVVTVFISVFKPWKKSSK